MSEEVEKQFGPDRRAFIKRLVVGAAFAAPVVASFSMAGVAAVTGGTAPRGIGPNTTDPGGGGVPAGSGATAPTAVVADPTTTG